VNTFDLLITLGAVAFAAAVLRSQAWRAFAALHPELLRLEIDAPADQMKLPAPLEPRERALRELGFQPLGRHLEQRPLGPSVLAYDYLSSTAPVFATLMQGGDGGGRLTFLTRTEGGGFVLTADHRCPARDLPGRYVSGGLEGAAVDRVYRAHLKRLEAFTPEQEGTLEGRLETEREWVRGLGRAEVRQQNLLGLLWSLGSLGMLAVVLVDRFGR
jgi:hypothetical protein